MKTLVSLLALKKAVIRDCGKEGDLASFKSAVLTPDPPQPGKNVTVMISYHMHTRIENGIQVCSSSVNWIPLLDEKTEVGPFPIGDGTLTMSALFPPLVGHLKTRVQWNAATGEPIMCVEGVYING